MTPEELVNKLKSEGVTVHAVPELPYAFEISGLDYLAGLKSFKEGLFYVQDVSSMLVAETAAPKKNDYVIDVCRHREERVPIWQNCFREVVW